MPIQTLNLENGTGLHARRVRAVAKQAKEFDRDVTVRSDGDAVTAKSTSSVSMLDCHTGGQIETITDGDNADEALTTLVELVASGLGE